MYLLLLSRKLCPTLCHPVDNSSPGPYVHGVSQERMLSTHSGILLSQLQCCGCTYTESYSVKVGQKVKNRCSILTHRCVQSITREATQMSLVPGRKERQRQRAQTRTPRRKRAGCWWGICEIVADTYTLLIL